VELIRHIVFRHGFAGRGFERRIYVHVDEIRRSRGELLQALIDLIHLRQITGLAFLRGAYDRHQYDAHPGQGGAGAGEPLPGVGQHNFRREPGVHIIAAAIPRHHGGAGGGHELIKEEELVSGLGTAESAVGERQRSEVFGGAGPLAKDAAADEEDAAGSGGRGGGEFGDVGGVFVFLGVGFDCERELSGAGGDEGTRGEEEQRKAEGVEARGHGGRKGCEKNPAHHHGAPDFEPG
jgi:hypothetical protein